MGLTKYKIRPYGKGFKIWVLTQFFGGFAWDDVKENFTTEEAAREYVEERKRKDREHDRRR